MSARFHRAGVVAGGQHHGADAVHDAFVMRRGTIRIGLGKLIGADDAVTHARAANFVKRPRRMSARQSPVRQIGEDAQKHLAAAPRRDVRCDLFRHGVDRIRPHRIAGIDDQMRDQHDAAEGVENPHLEVAEAAAELDQQRIAVVADALDLVAPLQQPQPRRVRIGHADRLHLRDHQGAGHRCRESAGVILPRGVADRRDHRGFLGRHRHQNILAVDPQVGGNADRHVHRGDDVLDHLVGQLHRQVAHVGEMIDGCLIEPGECRHQIEPLGRGLAMKASDTRAAIAAMPGDRHSSPSLSSGLSIGRCWLNRTHGQVQYKERFAHFGRHPYQQADGYS